MKSTVYTEQIHAKRLIKILENPEGFKWACPASKTMESDESPYTPWSAESNPCIICRNFITKKMDYCRDCPCHFFGTAMAREKSWIALETKGYI